MGCRAIALCVVASVATACSGGASDSDAAAPTDTAAPSDAGAGDAADVVTCPNNLPAACPSPAPDFAAVSAAFQRTCAPCHQPGGVGAPRYLQTYAEVYAQRQSVLDQIYNCSMPPRDAGQLTDAERATILAWLVCHAPM